ncbi:MAG: TetR/AcrR family transcriptional regulator [Bacilli bacterium]|nr:TetR/AcrR family transcriptional regulator [Bacilli bacterium]
MESKRMPIQKRSIEKRDKIIRAGFELICSFGYHNTNTAEIAKKAGVSTGIVYQYFEDKHDILIEGLKKYSDEIFYPMMNFKRVVLHKNDLTSFLENLIEEYLKNHTLSSGVHQEMMAMVHEDSKVAFYYYQNEMRVTYDLYDLFLRNGFDKKELLEKVHVILGMIDHLCHEIVYHRHENIDYTVMKKVVIFSITTLF